MRRVKYFKEIENAKNFIEVAYFFLITVIEKYEFNLPISFTYFYYYSNHEHSYSYLLLSPESNSLIFLSTYFYYSTSLDYLALFDSMTKRSGTYSFKHFTMTYFSMHERHCRKILETYVILAYCCHLNAWNTCIFSTIIIISLWLCFCKASLSLWALISFPKFWASFSFHLTRLYPDYSQFLLTS